MMDGSAGAEQTPQKFAQLRSPAMHLPSSSKGLKSIHSKIHNASTFKSGVKSNLQAAQGENFLSNEELELDTPRLSDDNLYKGGPNSGRDVIRAGKARPYRTGGGMATTGKKNPFRTWGQMGSGLLPDETPGEGDAFVFRPTVLPGQELPKEKAYEADVQLGDYPETGLDSHDYQKRLRFDELKKTRLEALCNWKQKDVKGIKKNAYIKEIQKKNEQILTVGEKNQLEKLEVYTDRFPLLHLRKQFKRVCILIHLVCREIINTGLFNNLCVTVIIANSVTMATNFTKPGDDDPPFYYHTGRFFIFFYIGEMIFKIAGLGFYFGDDAYLKDSWNVLDFAIVMFSLLDFVEEGSTGTEQIYDLPPNNAFSLTSLRVVRVLRPLKTISSVKGLKVLMQALFSAIPLLRDAIIILVFFYICFAIAGLQLFSGKLRQRCFEYQTGQIFPDDEYLCGIKECPGGYFCGKGDKNPNADVTCFDNVMFGLLTVFQCVTLEGWSDVQRQMQNTFSMYLVIYFIPLIFIGAFFLLNLTLAVINSQFTIAHKHQQELDAQLERRNKMGGSIDDDLETAIANKDEMSIAQFITARIYAKKMIEFLRMRQEIKRIELERIEKVKRKQQRNMEAKRNLKAVNRSTDLGVKEEAVVANGGNGRSRFAPQQQDRFKQNIASPNDKSQNGELNHLGSNVIREVPDEHIEEQSEGEQFGKEVKSFIKAGKGELQRQGKNAQDIQVPSRVIHPNGLQNGFPKNLSGQPSTIQGGPKMKGNIGPSIKNIDANNLPNEKQKAFSRLAEEFDIDNIIPKDFQKKGPSADFEPRHSDNSFDLSMRNYELESNMGYSEEGKAAPVQNQGGLQHQAAPGLSRDNDDESGLITSDSDFEVAEQVAGYVDLRLPGVPAPGQGEQEADPNKSYTTAQTADLGKDISKTFKKMLTSNHQRLANQCFSTPGSDQGGQQFNDSTKYAGSNMNGNGEFEELTQLSEIEMKFLKKKSTAMKRLQSKIYKEDEDLQHTDAYGGALDKQGNAGGTGLLKTKKEDIRQLEEFISTKRPKDPFKDLDPLVDKVEITKDLKYLGTSQNDVFQARLLVKEKMGPLEENGHLRLNKEMAAEEEVSYMDHLFVRSEFQPYQQKTFYDVKEDSTDPDTDSSDEAVLYLKEQPFMTATNIAYRDHLKQVAIPELARRSDILITSTLSMSVFPKDKRMISQRFMQVEMDRRELTAYLDEKTAFQAMCKEHQYGTAKLRDKDKEYRDNYLRSFIHKAQFRSKTLTLFKKSAMGLNANAKVITPKDRAVLRAERLKHEQNKRASEKRGLPKWDMRQAKQLLDGKFHEEDEEDDDEIKAPTKNRNIFAVSYADVEHSKRIQKFEMQLRKAQEEEEEERDHANEIPKELKTQLNLGNDMGIYEINFPQLRRTDVSLKKQTPFWSGQDVMPDQIDFQKSTFVVGQLNMIRVWPLGCKGLIKRIRFVLRIIVKHAIFDSLMTFMVLCNTVTLALERHGMQQSLKDQLFVFNVIFTYTFITEMFLKLLALGVGKYCAEPMNWLDGTVVCFSLLEESMTRYIPLVMDTADNADTNLKSMQTLRLLRTFRVFRIARILRSLESMKMIISVMQNSWKSFIYITMLMFLFILILTLLGITWFVWKFGPSDDPYTFPRSNYDTFWMAFATVFQVLTMENWQAVLYDGMQAEQNHIVVISLYLCVWIVLGNWILLNLFLAILLDSFLEEDEDAEAESEALEQIRVRAAKRKAKKTQAERAKFYVSHTFKDAVKANPINPFLKKDEEHEELEDLDEDQIIQIFKDQGIISKSKEEIRAKPLFVGIECNQAMYLFPKDSVIRKFCYRLSNHHQWENFILLLIILSSFKLASDSFTEQIAKNMDLKGEALTDYLRQLWIIDRFFTYAFLVEMLVKWVAKGVIMDDNSYLRDSWNQLDFIIVASSLLEESSNIIDPEAAISGEGSSSIKILRILRVLRPLRFISHNVAMKLIVTALLESVGHIINVLFVVGMIFLIFAIMGVSFFAGKFYYCNISRFDLHTRTSCEFAGGTWDKWDHNFDDVSEAMSSLFVVSSLEGWPNVMYQALDYMPPLLDVEQGPKRDPSNFFPIVYFVTFIMLGSFFFLNFFIGVLFLKFNQAQAAENKGFTKKDLDWKDIQRLILKAEPDYETTNVPDQLWRRKFHTLASHQTFENLIMTVIVLNMLTMGMDVENSHDSYDWFLKVVNICFSVIFFCEACLKLVAYGSTYFQNSWNKFDFFVVVTSVIDIVMMAFENQALSSLASAPQLARVVRVLRLVRLLGKAKNLQTIIQTIQFAIPSLINVFALLQIMFFMFAVLGNSMFASIIVGEVIDSDVKNFKDTLNSFFLMYALSTGEDWNVIMYDTMRTEEDGCIPEIQCVPSRMGWIFFFMTVLVCTHVMLNLFVLVIIKQFETYYLPKDNNITKFNEDKKNFMNCWALFTQERYRCRKIKENQLTKFFRKLGEIGDRDNSLGFSEEYYEDGELKKQLLKMAIKSDNGYIYFNELLYRCMRRRYGNMKINKQMQVFELRSQYLIYMMTLEIQRKSKNLSNDEIFDGIIRKENGVNPFLTVMNFKISFKTWLKQAKRRVRQAEKNKNLGDGFTLNDTTTSMLDDDKPFLHQVEIEIEEMLSETDDEEITQEASASLLYNKKKSLASGSNQGSGTDLNAQSIYGIQRKKQDHLKLFEKKMTQRFKDKIKSPGKSALENKSSMVSPSPTKNAAGSPASASAKKGLKSFKEDKLLNGKQKPPSGAKEANGKSSAARANGKKNALASDSPS